jgi:hypothetical protein
MIKIILLSLSVLSLVAGIGILSSANSAIHEIESFILFTIFAILFSGYGILGHIDKLQDTIRFKANDVVKQLKE